VLLHFARQSIASTFPMRVHCCLRRSEPWHSANQHLLLPTMGHVLHGLPLPEAHCKQPREGECLHRKRNTALCSPGNLTCLSGIPTIHVVKLNLVVAFNISMFSCLRLPDVIWLRFLLALLNVEKAWWTSLSLIAMLHPVGALMVCSGFFNFPAGAVMVCSGCQDSHPCSNFA